MVVEHHLLQSTRKEVDYISLLPDCLLIDIISRLPITKEAIRTGTLSKRWQHLWPYVHNLIFIDFYCKTIDEFVSSVHKTLTQCRQSNLHKFQICIFPYAQMESQVNNWIRYAVSRNVKDLNLSLEPFVLDEFICINSCFTRLTLDFCSFNPTCAISWTKLTSLYIGNSDLSQDLIQNILSGCPLLETLELEYCCGFRRIDITSKSVKNFVFSGYHRDYEFEDEQIYGIDDVIEINAPYIVSLTIAGSLWLSILLLVDVSCLVSAHLNYQKSGYHEPAHVVSQIMSRHEETLMSLILSLRYVKELKIGKLCFEVLSCLEEKGFIFPSNLKVDVASPLSNDTHSDSIELSDTSHSDSNESGDSDSNESGDSEGIVEQVSETCCGHNCGRGGKLAGGASTTCAQSQESMYTQKQVDAMFEAQNKMIATQHSMITAQSLQFSTLVRALIKSGFPVPDSIIPRNVNEGNEEKDGEDENDK